MHGADAIPSDRRRFLSNILEEKEKGVAIDPTCINIRRLERTKPNLIHFKWAGGSVDIPQKNCNPFFGYNVAIVSLKTEISADT